jgi:predicted SPOUT superfamily RNA methylase MTH1
MNLRDRICIAIPDSSLSDEMGLREKTIKIGKFARAFSIFGVEKIVIYKDPTEKKQRSDMLLIKLILEFLNTPPYLRKSIYPISNNLSFTGLLPPIKAPHHKNKVNLKDVKLGEIRVGLLQDRSYLIHHVEKNKFSHGHKFISSDNKANYELYIDVGLDCLIPYLGEGNHGEKVVVKFINKYPNLKVVRASTKDLENLYFGYSIEKVTSLEEFFKNLEQKTFVIFTSKNGRIFKTAQSQLNESIKHCENLVIVFGSPSKGIKEIYPNYDKTKHSMYLNMFPFQKTQTIRLEEALLGTLSIINNFLF